MILWIKKLSLVLFGFIFLEIFLQILTFFSPKIEYLLSREQERWMPDQHLGSRPRPDFPEHDQRGFRNKGLIEEASIVGLGDSQTYGWKVQRFQAWPQRLENLANLPVYNMGVPRYGPVHSLLLWQEATTLRPKYIVEGFYLGNDLFDCFDMVYGQGFLQELKTENLPVLKAVHKAGKKFVFDATAYEERQVSAGKEARNFLAERSKLYGFFRAWKRYYYYNFVMVDKDIHFTNDWNLVKRLVKGHSEYWVFEGRDARTVLNIGSNLAALDLSDPRMAEGLRIALEVFGRMNTKASADKIHFLVLLIPTKELVFKDVVTASSGDIPDVYENSAMKQEELWQTLKKSLEESHIEYVDTLPALRQAIQDGNQPFPISANAHLNSTGHAIVAETVWNKIKTDF